MAVQQFPVATTFEKTRLLSEDFDELPFWYVVPLIESAGAEVVAKVAILAEGDAADRDDIIFLEHLPLF